MKKFALKRTATAALAALTLTGAMATTASAAPGDRYDRSAQRNDRNDRNDNRRWDARQYNGYTYNGRWNYGPPPASIANRAQFGYHAWRRGERIPAGYQSHFRQVDWRRDHLRAPPRGYHYVRDDRGDTLLVAVATGVILSAILASH